MDCDMKSPNEPQKPFCCRIGCDRDAVYELRNTFGSYEDYTHSCDHCVAELFFDGCNSVEKTPWIVSAAVGA